MEYGTKYDAIRKNHYAFAVFQPGIVYKKYRNQNPQQTTKEYLRYGKQRTAFS